MSTEGVMKIEEGVFAYDYHSLNELFGNIIRKNVSPEACQWLSGKAETLGSEKGKSTQLNLAFAAMPRKTGKAVIQLAGEEEAAIKKIRPGLSIKGCTADRLSRVWLLMQLDASDKAFYFKTIDSLFLAAEMNELVALYSSLPLLAYPEQWQKRCAEGIRSNIGIVLESIICNNPYPSEQLPEPAWNQLVMKAFFTEKQIDEIIGLDKRRNRELANMLTDYAHERWVAGRPVHPMLWRCVAPFIDDNNIAAIKRAAHSDNSIEKEAAALACSESNFPVAKQLLQEQPELQALIQSGKLTWKDIAQKLDNHL